MPVVSSSLDRERKGDTRTACDVDGRSRHTTMTMIRRREGDDATPTCVEMTLRGPREEAREARRQEEAKRKKTKRQKS